MNNPLEPQYNYPGNREVEKQYEDFIRNSGNKTTQQNQAYYKPDSSAGRQANVLKNHYATVGRNSDAGLGGYQNWDAANYGSGGTLSAMDYDTHQKK